MHAGGSSAAPASPGPSADQPDVRKLKAGDDYVTLNFTNIDIAALVKVMSELMRRNFILDERVTGKVTLMTPTRISPGEAYQVFLDAGAPTDYLRQLALTRLGQAYEKGGKPAEAQAAFAAAADLVGPFGDEALLGEARVAEEAADSAKARALYEQFLEKYATSDRRALVMSHLIALGWKLPGGESADSGASAGGTAAEIESLGD